MNKFLKEQLEKCNVAMIPPITDDMDQIVIPMGDKNLLKPHFQINHYYLIELEQYLITPTETMTLHSNWNKGIAPLDKYMKCVVEQFLGKMIKITGIGYDYENQIDKQTSWEGWLPMDSVTIIKEIL